MSLKVVQWGTGVVGAIAARTVIAHPDLDLVGCFAHGAAKVGQDVGTILGGDPIGVLATDSVDAIVALRPDCVLYMPLAWNVDDMVRLLEGGINVISTANFITGLSYGKDVQARLDAAAKRGGVSLHGTGINPGLANALGLMATGVCTEVNRIMVREAVDATRYASRDTWLSLGFGGPPTSEGLAEKVRDRTLVFTDAVEMMAAALRIEIDEVAFSAEFGTATEDLALGYMDIPAGTVCGLKMIYSGRVGGVGVIDLELIWRLGHAMTPDWPVGGYVVEVEGTPNVRATLHTEGDTTGGGGPTGMNAVHAVAAVCAARPGLVTAADLPLIVAARCVVPKAAAA